MISECAVESDLFFPKSLLRNNSENVLVSGTEYQFGEFQWIVY